MTLIIFILMLGLIVFVHEFGHFIFAKKNGIYVYEFSIGFGPKLFSFKRKNDPTVYMVKLIPLGGYTAMAGEEDNDGENYKGIIVPKNQKLCNKTLFQRFIVMFAGAMNNFILGVVLLFLMGIIYGVNTAGTTLNDIPTDGAMYEAGARNGDTIVKIDNKKVKTYDDIQMRLAMNNNKTVSITLSNSNVEKTYKVTPKLNKKDNNYYYGISVKVEHKTGLLVSIKYAFEKFWSIYKSMFVVIGSMITGALGLDSLSGPVGIYNVVGEAKSSLSMIMYLTAYLSINIGFMNLIPFPAFDGGRILFLFIEKIKGSKVNPKVESTLNTIGFMILMFLLIVITIKDVVKLI